MEVYFPLFNREQHYDHIHIAELVISEGTGKAHVATPSVYFQYFCNTAAVNYKRELTGKIFHTFKLPVQGKQITL